jgi:hypothetical protein
VPALEGATEDRSSCPPELQNFVKWDIATYVSELFTSVDGRYVDTMTNIDCGSIRMGAARLSLVPYDLQVNPDTWGPTNASASPVLTIGNDAVFARLMQSLYSDLAYVQRELACKIVDQPSQRAPLASNTCNGLTSTWNNGKLKLDKCIEAAFSPSPATRIASPLSAS